MAVAPKSVTATVAKGRTVAHGGKHHGPGAILTLSAEDADYLRGAGFLMNAEAEEAVVEGPTLNGQNGSVVSPQ